ncbi:hypothetical protein [Enterobacter phage 04_vB_Eclo_IJM]|nr:hypothetical protein [Enterobacter phage 04_vB_Eclo_IJM]
MVLTSSMLPDTLYWFLIGRAPEWTPVEDDVDCSTSSRLIRWNLGAYPTSIPSLFFQTVGSRFSAITPDDQQLTCSSPWSENLRMSGCWLMPP